ncbi:protein TolQ [Halodesulfovibrio spirochaetisodalis]|uniref:Cell division protein TolQ n=1 Tax=Halodesulfovibrio spirochaetisodalis TaxID=1560234 RepID=A0A1B7XH98_9BACT|nr:protein TolQ [Halodesulfovibrio spirochaetisodalis]OBQ54884.1 cell division protein TolQ [Halodesulfovibrio spirochaetisodalis]
MGDTNIFMLIGQATIVVKVVLGMLAGMSLISWTIMFNKWITLNSAKKRAANGIDAFQSAKSLREAVQAVGTDSSSPLYFVAQQGVDEYTRLRESVTSSSVIADNVKRSLDQGVSMQSATLSSALPFLATCANSAPFIGLFGTVWGIMHSFQTIGQMKTAALAAVAPGISEALVATAIGLAVAIPAAIGYNMFLGKLQDIEVQLGAFAGVFLNRVQRELHTQRTKRTSGEG